MTETNIECEDQLIEKLRVSRDNTVVKKTQIIKIRSHLPKSKIFIFEGSDDKQVYESWISKACGDTDYEPFCCKGKTRVLLLREALEADRSGLIDGIYFFIDRDFDDTQGKDLGEKTFMTDRYSVENYLVERDVLDSFLKNDMHLNGDPKQREMICDLFEELKADFLRLAKPCNEKIYIARRTNTRLKKQLPADCKKIAKVKLKKVECSKHDLGTWICYDGHISPEEEQKHRSDFEALEPEYRYRGKFLLDFFKRWWNELTQDFTSQNPELVVPNKEADKINFTGFTLSTLAIRSNLPNGLKDFLEATEAPTTS